ncbi:MAG: uroporphyrinogen decarboxylase [Firmicutes bacterium]|nr:uroporphyrinogen decarboxylase [Bacillota bacterium]
MDRDTLYKELERYKDQMTAAERSRAYAAGEEVDRLPAAISVRETMAPLYGYSVSEYRRQFAVRAAVYQQAAREFGCHGIAIGPNLKKIGEALGAKAVYPEQDADYLLQQPLTDYADLGAYEPPQPESNAVLKPLLDEIGRYKAHFGDGFPVKTEIGGPMSTAISIRPVEMVMADCRKHPQELQRLLDFSVECQLLWVQTAHRLFGVTGVNIADPAASLNLLSPRLFRQLILPRLRRLVEETIRITGKRPSLHICGKTAAIWPDLATLDIASFRVDDCESLALLQQAAGEKIAIAGNIPPVEVMLQGSTDQVLQAGKRCIEQASGNPMGFTLAAGCQLPPGVSRENLLAMLLAARKYGRHARKGRPCAILA